MRLVILSLSLVALVGCGVQKQPKASVPNATEVGKCMIEGVDAKNNPTIIHCRTADGKFEGVFHR
jgi:hypothetical protein